MAEPIELSTEPLHEPVASCDTAISCLARLSAQNGGAARIEAARGSIDLANETVSLSRFVELAAEFSLCAMMPMSSWSQEADAPEPRRSASGIHITMASCSLCHAKILSGPGPDMR